MKNKLTIFIIFFFIFSLTSRSASTNEFTFETEEIKIFENGNLTKAYNVVATSVLNNFFITAEEFEYNNNKSMYMYNQEGPKKSDLQLHGRGHKAFQKPHIIGHFY